MGSEKKFVLPGSPHVTYTDYCSRPFNPVLGEYVLFILFHGTLALWPVLLIST
jgi:hypothetical protein